MTNTPADDGQTADGPGSDQRSIVIDAVLHPYNFLPENARNEIAEGFCKGTYATLGLTGDKAFVTEQEYRRNWSIGELADIVFTESDVDLGVYHAVPWFDYFDDGLVSNEKGIEMHGRWPDRVMFYGTLDPLRPDAVEIVEHLVKDCGACGIKLYPENWDYKGSTAEPVMLDAPNVAPVLEKTLELGVPLAIHKAIPAGHGITDFYRVGDVEQAAMRYPDLQIEVVHSGAAFLEETAFMLMRYPNVWANLEVTSAYAVNLKQRFAHMLGALLASGAGDRIIFATGAVLVHPQPVLDAFQSFVMPSELSAGYGYPPLDQATLDGILGLNFARLHGLDPTGLLSAIADDEFSRRKGAGLLPRWSGIRRDASVPA
jgi:predicted TIM-barrel fold metal-dependent hydrolase